MSSPTRCRHQARTFTQRSRQLGVLGIDDGRIRVALEVGRDEFFLGVGENAPHRPLGGGFQRGVDGFLVAGLSTKTVKLHNADVGRGTAMA